MTPRLLPLAVAVTLLLGGCLGGKVDADKLPMDAPLPGSLAGVVFDAAIRPLAGVTVSIPSRPDVAANVTGADGEFLLPDVGAGTVVLAAEKPGYLSATLQATVGGDLVQILLEPLAETKPYVVLESYRGLLECGLGSGPVFGMTAGCRTLAGGGLYVLCSGSDPVPPTGVCLGETNPYFISQARGNMSFAQTEAVWTPTVQGQSELLIGAYVVDGGGAIVGGAGTASGHSVLVLTFDPAVLREQQVGGANSLALFINPGNSGPANVVVEQSYEVFHTSTFFFAPPADWTFAEDGAPLVPDTCTVCLAG